MQGLHDEYPVLLWHGERVVQEVVEQLLAQFLPDVVYQIVPVVQVRIP